MPSQESVKDREILFREPYSEKNFLKVPSFHANEEIRCR